MPNNRLADRYAATVASLRAAGCVFAEDEARLLIDAADSTAELDELIERRSGGVPLELILGWVEFCGLRLRVAPGVLSPGKEPLSWSSRRPN